jgi:3-oxoacyl-[acyl-carrier protein] reductase
MDFNQIKIGDSATVVHEISEVDIDKFVELTGDDNRLHVDSEFAKKTEFKKPVVHGMLGASFISTVIGTKLPGDGALWFSQTLEFLRPVRIGDTITVLATVISKYEKSNSIELKTEIINQHNQIVTNGISKVKIIKVEETDDNFEHEKSQSAKKKSVLVLGASGGIGKKVSEQLAKDGFEVIMHYRSNKLSIDLLLESLILKGAKGIGFKADLLKLSDINELVDFVKRKYPDLSGIVNCSTVNLPNIKFENLQWDEIQKHIDINIKSSFLIVKELMPIFVQNRYGKLVFITSQAIETPSPEWLHYVISKSALLGFVKSLAIEFANKGINVNAVSPSMVDTDLVSEIPKKAKMLIEAKTPVKRLCTTGDVANAVSFLMSDNSNFITGETVRVNGGQIML